MKFTLKKVRHAASLSEETNAYTADLYIDGKKAGYVRNDGGGGPTEVQLFDLSTSAEREAVYDWVKAQPPKVWPAGNGYKSFTSPLDLESITDDLFSEWIAKKNDPNKRLRNWCKTKLVFRLKGAKPEDYMTLKGKDNGVYTKRLKAVIEERYPGVEIINERFGEKPV